LSEEVGRFFNEGQFTGAKFMALYHPAFILRNMSMKPVMREHLARFQKYWRQTIGDTEETACWKK
jgi:uracil-DNA glycosylase